MSSEPASVNVAVHSPAESKAAPRRRQCPLAPSAREFYSGLAVLTALAAVSMMRGGTPGQSMAGDGPAYTGQARHIAPDNPPASADRELQSIHAGAGR